MGLDAILGNSHADLLAIELQLCQVAYICTCYLFFGEANNTEKRKKWIESLDILPLYSLTSSCQARRGHLKQTGPT